jgi:hypothetical protein
LFLTSKPAAEKGLGEPDSSFGKQRKETIHPLNRGHRGTLE